MGAPYQFVPDSNPPVGGYDIYRGLALTQTQNKSTFIRKESSPYRRPKEREPEPGQYNASTHKSWTNEYLRGKNFTIGERKEDSPNRNPGPGYYEPEKAN